MDLCENFLFPYRTDLFSWSFLNFKDRPASTNNLSDRCSASINWVLGLLLQPFQVANCLPAVPLNVTFLFSLAAAKIILSLPFVCLSLNVIGLGALYISGGGGLFGAVTRYLTILNIPYAFFFCNINIYLCYFPKLFNIYFYYFEFMCVCLCTRPSVHVGTHRSQKVLDILELVLQVVVSSSL